MGAPSGPLGPYITVLNHACRICPPHNTLGKVNAAHLLSTLGNFVFHHRGVARGSPFLQFSGTEVSPGSHGQQQRALRTMIVLVIPLKG